MRIAAAYSDGGHVWTFDGSQVESLGNIEVIIASGQDLTGLSIKFSPDTNLIALGLTPDYFDDAEEKEFYISLWDISKSCVLATVRAGLASVETGLCTSIVFANMNELYTASIDGLIKRWLLLNPNTPGKSVTTLMCVRTFTGHQV